MSGPGFTSPGLGWTVLVTLATSGPATARAVAEASRYSVGGTRVHLRAAERAGLVQSQPTTGSGSPLVWSLTPAGVAYVAQVTR